MNKFNKTPKRRENRGKSVKTASLLVLTVVFILILCGAASAADNNVALNTTHNGAVSGDLYVNATQPVAFADQPTDVTSREFNQTLDLPTNSSAGGSDIEWAQVYVNIYSGSGSNNSPLNATILLDGDGDGVYETTLGTELLTSENYSTDGTIYWINDHCYRVYSDYLLWYDVTGLITCTNPSIYVKTEQVDTDNYDGRLKMITLVAAYNDGDNDVVHYWVNDGQDWITSGSTSSTSFDTSTVTATAENATLNTVVLSSKDGTYAFNGETHNGTDPVAPVNYFVTHTWDVTAAVTRGNDSTLNFTAGSSSFKSVLATLTIREALVAPVANFMVNTTSGFAPLTVQFTDESTETATGWAWDFDNDGNTDSTKQNPIYTYSNAGIYTVNLTVSGAGSNDTETKTNYITATANGLANTTWPKFQNDLNNTGQSENNGPTTNTVLWTYTTGGELYYGSPVIGSDGTIYVGSSDKNLYALNPDGTLKWTYTTGNRIYGSPSIAADGTIYVGSSDKNLYALNPDGTLKWSYTTGSYIYGSAAIDSDGTIYIGDNNGNLYALNPDGTLKWSYKTGGTINYYGGSPAIGSDGTIYVGSYDKKLYALNPDGTLKWSYTTGSYIYGSAAIGSDGTIYIGSRDSKLYALNPDGTLKWSYTTGSYIYGSAAIGSDGTIYIGSRDSKLYALNPDGTLKWSYTTGSYIYGSAAIGSDGTIYIGSRDSKLYALNPDGTLKWSYTTAGYIYESPAIGSDGTIYVGSNDKNLYAFKDVVPVADFTADKTTGGVPITLYFTDHSLYATSWAWDFNGDGVTDSTEQNPSYTFTEVGIYVVSLTASNAFASNTTTLSIELSALPPVVNFTADVTIGTSPLTVQFTDQSRYATSWAWDFDSDGNVDSIEQNPTYIYQSPGNYSVTLTATGVGGSQSTTLTDYINVDPVPVVNFTADIKSGTSPLTVQFTDQSRYATSWAWDFDSDGVIDSTEQNPTYIYQSPGIYSVTLTVSNPGNTNSLTNNGYIVVVPCVNNSLSSGTYSSAQTATLTSDDPTATIYYTTDTTDPRTSSTRIQYTIPITIDSTNILLYAAISSSGNWSPLYVQYYTFGIVGLADTAWPTFGRDLNGTGQSSYTGSALSNLAWTYSTGGAISSDSSATIGADGTIYVGSTDKNLYALNPDGTLKWIFTTGGTVYTPTIGSDGTIYIGSTDKILYALNQDGTLKWSYTTAGSIQGAAKIGTDGTIYVAGGGLYALNQDGTLKWSYSAGSYTPVIGTDGTIYVTSGSSLYAINPDGTLKWSILLAQFYSIYGSPAIGPDGTIYVGSTAFALHAVNPDGTLKWNYSFPAPGGQVYYCSPVVGADGTIYIGTAESPSLGNNFYAINPDGTLKWGYATGSYVFGSAAIGADGTVYIGSNDGKLYALNQDGTLKWTYTAGGQIRCSPSIGSDGTIYIGSNDGKLYALNILPPVPSFTTDVVSDYAPLTVQFTDTSTENPSSWEWDFDNDGVIDSTEQNPTYTYTTPGTYTVKLTVSNEKGSNSLIMTDYITVTIPPVDTESPTVTASPIGGNFTSAAQVTLSATDNLDRNPTIYYTTDGTDPTTESTKYTGTITLANTTTLKFIAADKSGNISAVQIETYTINDTEAPTVTATQSGTTVTLSATDNVDPNPKIYYTTDGTDPTTSSTPYSAPFTIPRAADTIVKFIALDATGNVSPVQSKTFSMYLSTDILTAYYAEGNIGVIVDNGGTGYGGGDPTYELDLPEDATILAAYLCLSWNWYGYVPYTVSFNGTDVSLTTHYVDGNDGQDIYDVTSYFNSTGTNTATITGGTANYGRTLIVVYQSASEPYREIWVNMGYDILYSNYGATGGSGNAFFKNVTNTQNTSSAEIIITLPSGDNDSPYILLNGENFSINNTGGSDPSFKYYTINTTAVQDGTNTLEVPVGGSYFSLQNAILIITYDFTAPSVSASMGTGVFGDSQTVTLTATDNMDTQPFIYYTIDGTTPTTNSTLYTGPINIDATTVLKFIAVDDVGNVSQVQSKTYTIDTKAPTTSANLTGGIYNNTLSVILSAKDNITAHPTIYYTIDGTTPTTTSMVYSGPITITNTTTLQFIAVDLFGNTSPVQTETYTINLDTEAPTITTVDPVNGTTSMAGDEIFTITFSEDIIGGTDWIELVNSTGEAIPFTMSISGNVLTITPTSDLLESAYKLMLHTGSLTDLAGNLLVGKSFRFSVGTAPTITTVDPVNGSTNVSVDKSITVTFSEAIRESKNFWVELVNSTGEAIPFTTTIIDNVLTITPTSDLAEDKYKLMLHTGSVTDIAGNLLAGQSFRFSVGTSPTITSTNPADGAINVHVAKTITVTFSEAIRRSSKFWVELVDSNGTSVEYTSYITSGNILVINPTLDLAANTVYKLKIHTGSVTDMAGNLLAAKVISFTTRST